MDSASVGLMACQAETKSPVLNKIATSPAVAHAAAIGPVDRPERSPPQCCVSVGLLTPEPRIFTAFSSRRVVAGRTYDPRQRWQRQWRSNGRFSWRSVTAAGPSWNRTRFPVCRRPRSGSVGHRHLHDVEPNRRLIERQRSGLIRRLPNAMFEAKLRFATEWRKCSDLSGKTHRRL